MANISNFYGTVTIEAESFNDLASLIYAHTMLDKNACYNTTLMEFGTVKAFSDVTTVLKQSGVEHTNDGIIFTTKISGSGRWSATNNFEWFFKVLLSYLCAVNRNFEICNHILLIQHKTFTVVFDYYDAEPGCDFIVSGSYVIQYDKGTWTVHDDIYESADCTAQNLIDYGFADDGEVFDTTLFLENDEHLDSLTARLSDLTVTDSEFFDDKDYLLDAMESRSSMRILLESKKGYGCWYELDDYIYNVLDHN